jgi:hypothetical protein
MTNLRQSIAQLTTNQIGLKSHAGCLGGEVVHAGQGYTSHAMKGVAREVGR